MIDPFIIDERSIRVFLAIDLLSSMNVLLGCFPKLGFDVMCERFIRVFTYLLYKLYHMIVCYVQLLS